MPEIHCIVSEKGCTELLRIQPEGLSEIYPEVREEVGEFTHLVGKKQDSKGDKEKTGDDLDHFHVLEKSFGITKEHVNPEGGENKGDGKAERIEAQELDAIGD